MRLRSRRRPVADQGSAPAASAHWTAGAATRPKAAGRIEGPIGVVQQAASRGPPEGQTVSGTAPASALRSQLEAGSLEGSGNSRWMNAVVACGGRRGKPASIEDRGAVHTFVVEGAVGHPGGNASSCSVFVERAAMDSQPLAEFPDRLASEVAGHEFVDLGRAQLARSRVPDTQSAGHRPVRQRNRMVRKLSRKDHRCCGEHNVLPGQAGVRVRAVGSLADPAPSSRCRSHRRCGRVMRVVRRRRCGCGDGCSHGPSGQAVGVVGSLIET